MKSKCIAAAAVTALVIAALAIKIVTDRRALAALRRSHEVQVRFCRGYRALIGLTRDELAPSRPLEVRRLAWGDYHLLAGGGGDDYYELCHVDKRQLEPERSHVDDCNLYLSNPDYSCFERAAAKLWQAIPDDFDP